MVPYTPLRYSIYILCIKVLFVACKTNNSSVIIDYVTSLSNKQQLLNQNGKLLLNTYEYIEELQAKIETLRKIGKHLHQPQLAAKGREEEFLSNPMNSLSLIRQMHADWTHVEKLMEQPVGQKQMDYIRRMNERRPRLENVEEAMVAMHRLKESYWLNASDIAEGLIDELQTDGKLSPLECYEMGLLYFNGSLYHKAIEWLETAKELMDKAPSDVYAFLGLARSNISHLLARSHTALGNLQPARLVLQAEPEFSSQVEELVAYFQENKPKGVKNEQLIRFHDTNAYLCSSLYKPKPTRLLCSYKTSPSPFLRLAPFRMEQIWEDPEIFVFHNMVSSSEIATLQRIMEKVMHTKIDDLEDLRYYQFHRTVRQFWMPNPDLPQKENLLVRRIRQRFSDLSDFYISDAYLANMLRYGYGGHYEGHNDFLNDTIPNIDDRIATIVLYLNDMPSGGGTMFPTHQLTVQPEAGKALLWYNLKLDTFDFETRNLHAACPVKIGTKWAMTQWIHEDDQMFTNPCLKPSKNRKY
ncbi:prolyl 4-hydroxylase subunit alpha-1-like [Drosophila nasuta]|uniref:prolyl 4-hydroxylase subunit alpha-1-like n=1 Tax=Drosophila nasuta TaxID=42062 RepID=UPI00295E4B49|nr:prolyl 4-hydroxylase subunit alpha-1-like [Drosophila nasuta]